MYQNHTVFNIIYIYITVPLHLRSRPHDSVQSFHGERLPFERFVHRHLARQSRRTPASSVFVVVRENRVHAQLFDLLSLRIRQLP